ncbi:hypothetical protein SLEP1_g51923 [Rubroshorea leprosula]|uniref:Uncharacterized protein n=1 Tax=Rubroshorea leprosula TaxID=152421 RepID=A0AAV5M827_9ROSI|nr:hypothetical protein SLEP1_g51923 [Rubroshorea leprosula]
MCNLWYNGNLLKEIPLRSILMQQYKRERHSQVLELSLGSVTAKL